MLIVNTSIGDLGEFDRLVHLERFAVGGGHRLFRVDEFGRVGGGGDVEHDRAVELGPEAHGDDVQLLLFQHFMIVRVDFLEAEIVFKGSSFTFYKDGKKITSGSYQIKDSDDDFPFWGYTNGVYHTPFSIKLNLAEWQTKKISEATNHAIFIWDWLSADIVRYDDPSKNLKLLFREKHVDGFIYSFERK